jgi:KDO2-lipid IV(A) lauroyltransferase
MFSFILYKIGAFIAQILPLQAIYRLAGFFSDLHLFFSPRDRDALENNLRIIQNSSLNVENSARDVSRNFGKYLADFFRFPLIDQEYVKKNIKLENLNYIDESLKKGKGLIIVSGHLGSWELGGVALSLLGYSVAGVVLKHKQKLVNDFFKQQRENKGLHAIELSDAPRKCMEYLKQNKIIILLVDRDFTQNGLVVEFLNKKTLLPKGAAVFSLKTGAPIIPGFIVRNNDNTFTLHFDSPIEPAISNDINFDIESLMKRYLFVIEGYIKKFPTQWLIFKEFWVK